MRKRKAPLVLRFHKPKYDVDPAAYFFSEALLYTSFRSEKELEERVDEAAKDGYKELEKEIPSKPKLWNMSSVMFFFHYRVQVLNHLVFRPGLLCSREDRCEHGCN